MKHALSSLLVATALVAPAAFAQTTATTKPVGYETIQLAANKFNIVGLRLQSSAVVSGAFEAIGTSTVTDNDVNFQTTLTSGKTYILEITSGTLSGLTVEATAGTGNNLNTVDNLSAAGITVGTTYVLRPALTLEEIFGTTNSVLKKGTSAPGADIVWVPNGAGSYKRYFQGLNGAWRDADAGASPNVPVFYTDAVFVEKRETAASLTVSGEVKTSGTTAPVITGFNLLSTVYPAGVTLQNFGLEDDVKRGTSNVGADVVWVPNGSGGYTLYWMNMAGQWREYAGAAVTAPVDLPPGVLLERRGAAAMFDFTPPSNYSGL